MAHIRRKFFDLVVAHQSPIAIEAVERIRSLYKIEEQIRGRPAEERRQVRNARARPLFESMRRWLEEFPRELAPEIGDGGRHSLCAQPLGSTCTLSR